MDSSSYTIALGQGVTFTATVSGGSGAPTGSITFRDNGVTINGCSAVAVASGAATCTTSALAAGSHAISGQYWGDSVYGTGIVGPITETVSAGAATADAAVNVQGLWWGAADGSQSGWGLNLVQQGATVFATWFTYDTDGTGMWLVMPNGAPAGGNTYTGALYRTTGPSLTAASFDAAKVGTTAVGSATFSFSDASNGVFTAVVNGKTVARPITREIFGSAAPTCSEGGSAGATPNYQDLWWQASGAEPGWGLNVAHQGDILFATWFTYDANGNGLWLVASNLAKTSSATYAGTLYRTTGPAFDSMAWDPSAVTATPVGSVTLTFADPSHGTLSASVEGASITKAIAREVYATPTSVCR
ncbi:MAG TPA: Ig-like domain-containing protein [Usitatibacter sp.]|nr:Ig-like domain-containing protein [Usitatibacter sp.]